MIWRLKVSEAPEWLLIDRLYVDADGETHFRKCRIPDLGNLPSVSGVSCVFSSIPMVVESVSIRIIPKGTDVQHKAPERRLVAILSGTMQVTASDGEVRRWSGGEIMLATDTGEGRGHRTRAIGGQVLTVVAKLPEDLDLDGWSQVGGPPAAAQGT